MHSFASTFMTASKGNRERGCRGHNSKALEHDPQGSHLVLRESVKDNPHFELQLLVMFGDPGALYIGEIRIKYQVSSTPLEKPVSHDCRGTMERDSVLCKHSELSLGSLHQGKHSVTLDSSGEMGKQHTHAFTGVLCVCPRPPFLFVFNPRRLLLVTWPMCVCQVSPLKVSLSFLHLTSCDGAHL